MLKLIILIPAFNEEVKIKEVIDKLPRNINGVDEINCVVIDDGSSDNTSNVAREAGAVIIKHAHNQGVGSAFISGIEYSLKNNADMVINIDADNQFEPDEIPKLIKPILEKQADFVSGNRFLNGRPNNMPLIKYWGNKAMNKLISYIAGHKYNDVSCGFRAYSREALFNLNPFGKFTYTQETFLTLSFKGLRIS